MPLGTVFAETVTYIHTRNCYAAVISLNVSCTGTAVYSTVQCAMLRDADILPKHKPNVNIRRCITAHDI